MPAKGNEGNGLRKKQTCCKVKSLDLYLISSWRNRIKRKGHMKNLSGWKSVVVHSERHYGNQTPPEKVQEYAYLRTSQSFRGP